MPSHGWTVLARLDAVVLLSACILLAGCIGHWVRQIEYYKSCQVVRYAESDFYEYCSSSYQSKCDEAKSALGSLYGQVYHPIPNMNYLESAVASPSYASFFTDPAGSVTVLAIVTFIVMCLVTLGCHPGLREEKETQVETIGEPNETGQQEAKKKGCLMSCKIAFLAAIVMLSGYYSTLHIMIITKPLLSAHYTPTSAVVDPNLSEAASDVYTDYPICTPWYFAEDIDDIQCEACCAFQLSCDSATSGDWTVYLAWTTILCGLTLMGFVHLIVVAFTMILGSLGSVPNLFTQMSDWTVYSKMHDWVNSLALPYSENSHLRRFYTIIGMALMVLIVIPLLFWSTAAVFAFGFLRVGILTYGDTPHLYRGVSHPVGILGTKVIYGNIFKFGLMYPAGAISIVFLAVMTVCMCCPCCLCIMMIVKKLKKWAWGLFVVSCFGFLAFSSFNGIMMLVRSYSFIRSGFSSGEDLDDLFVVTVLLVLLVELPLMSEAELADPTKLIRAVKKRLKQRLLMLAVMEFLSLASTTVDVVLSIVRFAQSNQYEDSAGNDRLFLLAYTADEYFITFISMVVSKGKPWMLLFQLWRAIKRFSEFEKIINDVIQKYVPAVTDSGAAVTVTAPQYEASYPPPEYVAAPAAYPPPQYMTTTTTYPPQYVASYPPPQYVVSA